MEVSYKVKPHNNNYEAYLRHQRTGLTLAPLRKPPKRPVYPITTPSAKPSMASTERMRPLRFLRRWHGHFRRPSAPEKPLPAFVHPHPRPSMINIQGRNLLSHEEDDRRSVIGRSTLALIEHEQGRALHGAPNRSIAG